MNWGIIGGMTGKGGTVGMVGRGGIGGKAGRGGITRGLNGGRDGS